jgi:hypothetical protein
MTAKDVVLVPRDLDSKEYGRILGSDNYQPLSITVRDSTKEVDDLTKRVEVLENRMERVLKTQRSVDRFITKIISLLNPKQKTE